MCGNFRRHCKPVILLMIVLLSRQVHGADDDRHVGIPGDEKNPQARLVAKNPKAGFAANVGIIVIPNNQPVVWLFATPPTVNKEQFEDQIRLKVDDLSGKYGLTSSQQEKIRRAAHNDVNKYVRDMQFLDKRIQALNEANRQVDVNQARDPWRLPEVKDIQAESNLMARRQLDLLGPESFVSKSLVNILTDDQMALYRADVNRQLAQRHRGNIEITLREIERRVVLSIPQQESLTKLMLEEIAPPVSIADQDYKLVRYRLACIPQSRLRPLFNDIQWTAVCVVLDEFQNLELELERLGLIAQTTDVSAANSLHRQSDLKSGPVLPANRDLVAPLKEGG